MKTVYSSLCCMYAHQEAIHRIKVNFNEQFDEVFAKKELELTKIKEKNKRIKKILYDIGVYDPIYEPEMGSVEKPELLLTTTDDEVKSVRLGPVLLLFICQKLQMNIHGRFKGQAQR